MKCAQGGVVVTISEENCFFFYKSFTASQELVLQVENNYLSEINVNVNEYIFLGTRIE